MWNECWNEMQNDIWKWFFTDSMNCDMMFNCSVWMVRQCDCHRQEKESFSVHIEKNSNCLNWNCSSMKNRFHSKMWKILREKLIRNSHNMQESEYHTQDIEMNHWDKLMKDTETNQAFSIQSESMMKKYAIQSRRMNRILFDDWTDIWMWLNCKEYEVGLLIMISIEWNLHIWFECLCRLWWCIVFQKPFKNNGLI